MWSDGKLELDSLKGYSKEYYQLVKHVPQFMEPMIESATSDMKDAVPYTHQTLPAKRKV